MTASQQGVVLGGNNYGFINTGTLNGDVIIIQGTAYPCNLYIPFSTPSKDDSPIKLLRWSSRLPRQLVGRDEEMRKLQNWVNNDTAFSCALIEGEAGVGKTRLAFELADQLKQQGWQAGQVKDPSQAIAFPASRQGTLLILDYPEEQPAAVEAFFDGLQRAGKEDWTGQLPKLRILLLCRDRSRLALGLQGFLKLETPVALHPLVLTALSEQEPWQLYQDARSAFSNYQEAAVGQKELTREQFQHWLEQDRRHGRALMIQTLALSQHHQPHNIQPHDTLVADLLWREKTHFIKQGKALGWSSELQKGAWVLQVLAAVAGKLPFTELNALASQLNKEDALGGRPLPSQAQWRELLGDASSGLTALEPDLFAAHALYNPDLMPDAETLAPVLIPVLLDESKLEDRLSHLARLHWDRPSSAKDQQVPDHWMQAAITTAEGSVNSPAWLKAFQRQPLAPALAPLAVAFFQKRVDCLEAESNRVPTTEIKAELARSLNNFFAILASTSDLKPYSAAVGRAVEIYEQLAEGNYTAYAPGLAASLSNLSVCLAQACEWKVALVVSYLSTEIYEKLIRDSHTTYVPDLANSLNNFSIILAKTGNFLKALEVNQRAVGLYEQLVKDGCHTCEHDLAKSLNNLSNRLAETGEKERALEASRQAVEIYERLAHHSPAVYLPDLVKSLNHRSVHLGKAGQREAALAAVERACDLIAPFALPHTPYANWYATMQRHRDSLQEAD